MAFLEMLEDADANDAYCISGNGQRAIPWWTPTQEQRLRRWPSVPVSFQTDGLMLESGRHGLVLLSAGCGSLGASGDILVATQERD
jgi:hypothetical protein